MQPRFAVVSAVMVGLAISGCTSTPGASSPSAASSVSTSVAAEPSLSQEASPSAAANCMDKVTLNLILDNYDKFDSLTPPQLATIVAALEAYDFLPADQQWSEDVLARLRDGQDPFELLLPLKAGQRTIEACS